MDEQPTDASVPDDGSDGAIAPIDLSAESTLVEHRGGGVSAWLGRAAIAVLAVALVAGGIALARDGDDESGGGSDLDPLALSLGGPNGAEAAADAIYPGGGYEYRLEGTLPDLGSEAPVYRLVRPDLTADDVAAMAAAVGIGATPQLQSDGSWLADDGSHSLSLYPGPGSWSVSYGGASFGATEPGSPGDVAVEVIEDSEPPVTHTVPLDPPDISTPTNLPDEATAEQIARDLLDSLGVLDDAEWQVTVQAGGMMGFGCAEAETSDGAGDVASDSVSNCGETQEVVTSWNVVFARVVGGVTTSGLEWSVDVGDGGTIDFAYGTLADLEELGDYPLRSTQAAFDELQNGGGMYPGPVPLGDPAARSAAPEPAVDVADPASGGGSAGPASTTAPAPADPDEPVKGCVDSDGTTYDCENPPPGVPRTTVPCSDGEECTVAPPGPCDPVEACAHTCEAIVGEGDAANDEGDAAGDPGDGVNPVEDACPPPCDESDINTTVTVVGPDGEAVEGSTAIGCVDGPLPLPPECEDSAGIECPPDVTFPPIEPTVVVVTGAELGATVIWGTEDGAEVQYLVPTYRFQGHLALDGIEWAIELVAVADSAITEPTPVTTPGTETTLPPDTAIPPDVPDCSNENPEGCVGSIPTTSAPDVTAPPFCGGDTGDSAGDIGAADDDPPSNCVDPPITTTSIVCITDPCEVPEESGGAQE